MKLSFNVIIPLHCRVCSSLVRWKIVVIRFVNYFDRDCLSAYVDLYIITGYVFEHDSSYAINSPNISGYIL